MNYKQAIKESLFIILFYLGLILFIDYRTYFAEGTIGSYLVVAPIFIWLVILTNKLNKKI